ncbi:hypothetical protein F3Y22_tig00112402pilonHSYRG00324 [Hibiscus syriacus]|uniref:Uncharacterized protein n=1 Tax=Hibiscus syriacus TaxID=106335 RepID=A0A6A2Y8D6_HIBSY|nr:hypothetical protein F3Y22_tig00112402pilonHSYRG00324 [Hibiscus syriacus]
MSSRQIIVLFLSVFLLLAGASKGIRDLSQHRDEYTKASLKNGWKARLMTKGFPIPPSAPSKRHNECSNGATSRSSLSPADAKFPRQLHQTVQNLNESLPEINQIRRQVIGPSGKKPLLSSPSSIVPSSEAVAASTIVLACCFPPSLDRFSQVFKSFHSDVESFFCYLNKGFGRLALECFRN